MRNSQESKLDWLEMMMMNLYRGKLSGDDDDEFVLE